MLFTTIHVVYTENGRRTVSIFGRESAVMDAHLRQLQPTEQNKPNTNTKAFLQQPYINMHFISLFLHCAYAAVTRCFDQEQTQTAHYNAHFSL